MKTKPRTAYTALGLFVVAPVALAVTGDSIDYNPYAFETMERETFQIEPQANPHNPGGA